MLRPPAPDLPPAGLGPSDTVLETDDDIRQALLAGVKGPQPHVPAEPKAAATPPQATGRTGQPVPADAPSAGATLDVFDDGKIEGEVVRLREPKFTIGRTEGDLRFPLDGRMSARHVEITHQVVGGLHRWVVTDLQSTHGMFIRVSRTALADKAEFLVGNGRYRFDASQTDRDATVDQVPTELVSGETQGWAEGTGPFRPPALTELLGREIGNRLLLVKGEYWIGSDPSCLVCRPDDPFCEPQHVRLYRG